MMKVAAVALIVAIAAVSSVGALDANEPVLHEALVRDVRGWKAGVNKYFEGWSIKDAQRAMGVLPEVKKFPALVYPEEVTASLPTSFDARKQWPGAIGPILNQGKCGACWAFGAVEALSDRLAIKNNGSFVQLAALDLVECDSGMFGNNGCEGGQLGTAWQYMQQYGVVTEACAPYGTAQGGPIPTCAPKDQPCLPPFVSTPACSQSCKNNATWSQDKHHAASVYSLQGEQQMMADIMQNGPIEAAFTVYQDFVHYKSGVYSHQTGSMLGGHAIKIIGWGEENSTPYWLVQNSWTTTWGDGGYFKILRGQDECGIEDGAVAGHAA